MVSDFRRKKLIRGFVALDTDKSGSIEKDDFDLALEKMKKARGWNDDDARFQEVSDFMTKFWEGLQKAADTDNDGKVTEEEWIHVFDEYAKNPSPHDWQKKYSKFIFDILDDGHDGVIDRDDYINLMKKRGKPTEAAEAAFEKISKGKSTISFEEFNELWKEYFITEDPDAVGNFIFGPLD